MAAARSSSPTIRLTPSVQAAWARFLDEKGSLRFRRQDLADRLFNVVRPRDRHLADACAAELFKQAAQQGLIQRHGHLHWVRTSMFRRLRSGRRVPDTAADVHLQIATRCPEKWVVIDLETGQSFTPGPTGQLIQAPAEALQDALDLLRGEADGA